MTEAQAIEAACIAGAVNVLRERAEVQRKRAAQNSASAGEKFPGVIIRNGEAAIAAQLAEAFDRIANEMAIKT